LRIDLYLKSITESFSNFDLKLRLLSSKGSTVFTKAACYFQGPLQYVLGGT
jgi:hypothetical protein